MKDPVQRASWGSIVISLPLPSKRQSSYLLLKINGTVITSIINRTFNILTSSRDRLKQYNIIKDIGINNNNGVIACFIPFSPVCGKTNFFFQKSCGCSSLIKIIKEETDMMKYGRVD